LTAAEVIFELNLNSELSRGPETSLVIASDDEDQVNSISIGTNSKDISSRRWCNDVIVALLLAAQLNR